MCLWRHHGDNRWYTGEIDLPAGEDPDGADRLFRVLTDATLASYRRFAEDTYATTLDGDALTAILARHPLTDDLVRRLNPRITLVELTDDLAEIGYSPLAG